MNYFLSSRFIASIAQSLLLSVLLTPAATYAKTNQNTDIKTLLTIKLYSEPHDKDKRLTYIMTLPKNENYSYYTGSDLPVWRFVDDRIIQGEFHSVSLVTIRIHPGHTANKLTQQDNARLTVIDPENARVVWQGDMHYSKNNNITVTADIDNQKYYDTKLKIDKTANTVWLETTDR